MSVIAVISMLVIDAQGRIMIGPGRKADNYGCLLSLFNPFVTVKAVSYYL